MRNDSLDELDDALPSLVSEQREPPAAVERGAVRPSRGAPLALWGLLLVLTLALAALGWWSQRELERMARQLVATQEIFARISEDAAGQLKDISGQVVAAESTVTSESEALKLRLKQLESRLAELTRREQGAAEQRSAQARQLEQVRGELQGREEAASRLAAAVQVQQQTLASLEERLKGLAGEQAALKAAHAEVTRLDGRLQGLTGELAALKKQGNPAQAIARLEEDLLVLRSQLDNRPAAAGGAGGSAEFDAFRAQVNRTITTLQGQVQNLQQQIDAR